MKHTSVSKPVEEKKDRKISISVWIAVIAVMVIWLFFAFYDGGFQFKEEDRLNSITLWIFTPFLILASLISLTAKSWGAFVSTIIFCCCLIYPPMEGFILFLNAKIGEPTDEFIDGTVIEVNRSGNKVITLHYKIKTLSGKVYTFETTWKGKVYKPKERFSYGMKKGFFGVLYRS
jgi:hypothetical protein